MKVIWRFPIFPVFHTKCLNLFVFYSLFRRLYRYKGGRGVGGVGGRVYPVARSGLPYADPEI